MSTPLEVVIIGAGHRGAGTFASYATRHPDRMRVAAFAEPHRGRREQLARRLDLPPERVFRDWRELLSRPRLADAAIVATADDLHTEPALAAMRAGYHLLLEKPMALDPDECRAIVESAECEERVLQIGHVLRYTPFYRAVHRVVVEEQQLGAIQTVLLAEHVAYWHFTHSFVRGKFRSALKTAPVILAKSCHDLDLMTWLIGSRCRRVASFGELVHFRPEGAPPGATARCGDGCPAEPECRHSALRLYGRDIDSWPWSDVALEPDRQARLEALRDGPYGVCVYGAGNDVADRQTVLLEFEGGVQATFLMDGFAAREERTLRIQGEKAELRGVFEQGRLEIRRQGEWGPEPIPIESADRGIGHGGGDQGLLDHFTDVARRNARGEVLASGQSALESHLIGFAAERARTEGRIVSMSELRPD